MRKPWDKRTLKAVLRWLRETALIYSKERERFQMYAGNHDTEIYGAARAAKALRDFATGVERKTSR